ncbi:hypothetical protein BD414DRAFT_512582 [Trametes punicea]|nr:hypothetical protein BD414DRAFT_512582 [Trametes punicea]
MSHHTSPKKFFPLPGCYGVMQMDPVAMVEDLGDPEALKEAKSMRVKKYIAYLYSPIELPWPNRPWYGYYVCPVAPSLRSEDVEKAIAPEMCIPIAPNTNHPTGRPPLVPRPPFPYSNCYHWVDTLTRVRIRAGVEFDDSRAVFLPDEAQIVMQEMFDRDMDRACEVLVERQNAARSLAALEHLETSEATSYVNSSEDRTHSDSTSHPWSDSSVRGSSLQSTRPSSIDSFETVAAFDPLSSHPDDDAFFSPLVDFCFDLTDHVSQEVIPDPSGFWEERDQILT